MVSADRDYLFYYPINKKINLEIKNREIFDDGGESRKVTFSESYYEIIDGKKKGVYTFITQSGKIESASYLNFSSKKEIDFQRKFGSNYKVPNIVKIIEDLEYESYTKAVPTINFTEDAVWKMLKTINGMENFKRYFNFENGKVSVEAYPNDESKLFLEILDLSNMKTNLKTSLNFKYVDLWFKWIKGDKFNMAIGKNNRSAIKFSKENTDYIVMPQVLR